MQAHSNDEHNLTPDALAPELLTATARLPSGETMVMRPLRSDDAARFGEYLCGLSEQTRARYGPHPFDQATADAICAALDPTDILRMVATVPRDGGERIIAYILLKLGVRESDGRRYAALGLTLDPATDASLAPSVADDYQNRGVGSAMMRHLLQVARKLGRKRIVLWDGVQATNARAVHFYTKWGFRKVGEFYTGINNFDMILDLTAADDALPNNA
ncbi:MAG TPA: GNAT family N-acetyltransferase [Chthonomonadaceae bacterium]|nr:GNAT family N-acetyltransferase [Chthonomonadaceae bacterium]